MDWLEIKEFFKDTVKYITLILFVIILVVYVISLQQVVGSSMNPNFNSNDIVILDKISYKFFDIKREDVVSVYYNDTKYLIKRVIGLPGENIEYKNNTLYINGNAYEETYLSSNIITEDFELTSLGYNTIPENYYLVLGDNRTDSLDSRDKKVGLISKENIIGKVRLRIWPINKLKIT